MPPQSMVLLGITNLRVLGMRGVVRILCLLRNQGWVKLLVAIDVSRVNVLRRLAVGLLCSVNTSDGYSSDV